MNTNTNNNIISNKDNTLLTRKRERDKKDECFININGKVFKFNNLLILTLRNL